MKLVRAEVEDVTYGNTVGTAETNIIFTVQDDLSVVVTLGT